MLGINSSSEVIVPGSECLFAEKHKLPIGESVCLNSFESVSQQRQKGKQSAPADTLSGLTQKACLGALNLNTHERWGEDWERESMRARE